jgi:hypothetical protein
MKKLLLTTAICLFLSAAVSAQLCTPAGDQSAYGNNNIWIGYVYNETNLATNYAGYVNEGVAGNPNFDQSFGGDNVNYTTNGCAVPTSTFSVRYKLTKTFNGTFEFVIGGDDGYRFSLDGGATWVINKWNDQGYTTTNHIAVLNGTYNLVLEYYENSGGNRISFQSIATCMGLTDPLVYGTNNSWNAYVYDGIDFDSYKGMVNVGGPLDPSFSQNFGGDNVVFNTNSCSTETDRFSVRYRLVKNFPTGLYTFVLGADDGYRLSLDGGATWVINNWNDHIYAVSMYSASLNGNYNMVIEYYERGGVNEIDFNILQNAALPITLLSFSGLEKEGNAELNWTVSDDSNPDFFSIEKSTDGTSFTTIGKVKATANNTTFGYTDLNLSAGKSFYRMKMTDLTQKVIYSQVIGIRVNTSKAAGVSVYPTILTGTTLYLETNKAIKQAVITVMDVNGKMISKQSIGKVAQGQITGFSPANSNLAKGIYFAQISDNNEKIDVKRFIVQ